MVHDIKAECPLVIDADRPLPSSMLWVRGIVRLTSIALLRGSILRRIDI
jgi:hypothetical protein